MKYLVLISNLFYFTFCCFLSSEEIKFSSTTIADYEYSISLFMVDNKILIWDSKQRQLLVFDDHDAVLKKVQIQKGQGPGEINLLSNIISYSNKYYIWDRLQKKFSIYDENWKFIETKCLSKVGIAVPIKIDKSIILIKNSKISSNSENRIIEQCVSSYDKNLYEKPLLSNYGVFAHKRKYNFDRSFLLSVYNQGYLYYAYNRKYEINRIDLKNGLSSLRTIISKKINEIPWTNSMEKIRWEVMKKSQNQVAEIFPSNLPPIYEILCNNKFLAVILNEGVLERKTCIDIYRLDGRYVGKLIIPMIWSQYVSLFPSDFYFTKDIVIKNDYIIAIVYDFMRDIYKVTKWKIVI